MDPGGMLAACRALVFAAASAGVYGQPAARGAHCPPGRNPVVSRATRLWRRLKSQGKKSSWLLCAGLLPGLALPAQAAVEINYGYDDLNRLGATARSDGPAQDFHYDEAGNLTGQAVSNSPDTDGDQTANFADPDDDGDGMPDAWEIQYGFNPLDPADAGQDADHDGITNLAEHLAGTSPLQPPGTHAAVPAVPEWGLAAMALALALIAARQSKRKGV